MEYNVEEIHGNHSKLSHALAALRDRKRRNGDQNCILKVREKEVVGRRPRDIGDEVDPEETLESFQKAEGEDNGAQQPKRLKCDGKESYVYEVLIDERPSGAILPKTVRTSLSL